MALPVNEYLNAVIITQLTIKLPLLAAWHTSFACPTGVYLIDPMILQNTSQ
jgi:hypothetical protein